MIDAYTAPYAVLILRVSLGILFLAHGSVKLFVFKPAGAAQYFSSLGLPGWLAYLAIGAEMGGGVFLVLGILPRFVSLLLIPLMLGTIFTVHGKNGWLFSNKDGGWEYPAFWAVTLLVLALLGDGAMALLPSSLLGW
ncbi:MAG: DoxX family protein [Pseudomonadota bacterium]